MNDDQKLYTVDIDFSRAVHATVNGDANLLASLLRSGRAIGDGERKAIISLAERCAELARGEIGGNVGRRVLAAGHPKVVRAVKMYKELTSQGMQKSEAKSIVSEQEKIHVRTLENYLKLTREREAAVGRAFK